MRICSCRCFCSGASAVLAQHVEDGTLHPVAFASRTLKPHEQNYGATELEALGVVWAAKHFRHYLYGHKFVIHFDHEALKSPLNIPNPSSKLARWGLILQDMDLGRKVVMLIHSPDILMYKMPIQNYVSEVVANLDSSGEDGQEEHLT